MKCISNYTLPDWVFIWIVYRTRYFTDSGIIGTKEFVSINYQRFKGVFMSKREKIPRRVAGLDGVYSLKRLAEWCYKLATDAHRRTQTWRRKIKAQRDKGGRRNIAQCWKLKAKRAEGRRSAAFWRAQSSKCESAWSAKITADKSCKERSPGFYP